MLSGFKREGRLRRHGSRSGSFVLRFRGIVFQRMATRRQKPCPPLAGRQWKAYRDYEAHMNQIRKQAEPGMPLEGDELDYAMAYLRWHEEWEEHLATHGEPEAVFVELNLDVPPYRDKTDQHQFWVHYEDGDSEVFSYKLDRSLFGHADSGSLDRRRKLRDIKLAARHIIRPLHEELKHRSALMGDLDVHHDKESFQSLLFRFFWDELGVRSLEEIAVRDMDSIGTKRFSPEQVAQAWYDFHEREATLVVMAKQEHQAWHSAHGKDADADWDLLL